MDAAHEEQLSEKYQDVLDASMEAEREYRSAVADYRAGRIGDRKFLEARRKVEASRATFDAAWRAERGE